VRPAGIRAARLIDVSGPLEAGGARAGSLSLGSRRGLLLRLEDEQGGWGQGEASPLPGYSPDTVEECRRELEAVDWGAAGTLDPTEAALAALLLRLDLRAPAARFAAETALLDLLGRRRGLSVSDLLRGSAAPARPPIPLSVLLPDGPPPAVAEAARRARGLGIRTVKLKVGRPGQLERELELARVAREAVGPDGALRLDANQGWSPAEAETALAALAPLSPEVIEEPVARWRELRMPSPVSIAADESLQAPEAEGELAERAARGALSAIVLKPMVLGGLVRCLRLARLADRHGLGTIVTHLFDGPIGLAAAAELALALPATWACGLAPHAALATWPPVRVPQLGPAAIAPAPVAGLGLPDLAPLAGDDA
jgi:o-succinylbenzoate synthase